MKISPIFDRVLVKVLEDEKETQTGLILPDNRDRARAVKGIVEAVGEGKLLDSGVVRRLRIKVGDNVMINRFDA